MPFSFWFSRLRSSSKSILSYLRSSKFNTQNTNSRTRLTFSCNNNNNSGAKSQFLIFSNSLLPLTLTIQSQTNSSLCDSPAVDSGDVSIGGKGSTEYAVKGSHKII